MRTFTIWGQYRSKCCSTIPRSGSIFCVSTFAGSVHTDAIVLCTWQHTFTCVCEHVRVPTSAYRCSFMHTHIRIYIHYTWTSVFIYTMTANARALVCLRAQQIKCRAICLKYEMRFTRARTENTQPHTLASHSAKCTPPLPPLFDIQCALMFTYFSWITKRVRHDDDDDIADVAED